MNKHLAEDLQSLFTKRYMLIERSYDRNIFSNVQPNNFYKDNLYDVDRQIISLANKILKEELKESREFYGVEEVYRDKEIASFIENNLRTLEF